MPRIGGFKKSLVHSFNSKIHSNGKPLWYDPNLWQIIKYIVVSLESKLKNYSTS